MKYAAIFTPLIALTLGSCNHQPFLASGVYVEDANNICFDTEVLPIFIGHCAYSGCHSAHSRAAGVKLDNYDNVMSTGGIVAGKPKSSELYRVITRSVGEVMPPFEHLDGVQISIIKAWIEQGAENTACQPACDSNAYTYSLDVQPIMDTYCRSCHSGADPNAGVSVETYDDIAKIASSGRLVNVLRARNGYRQMPEAGPLDECDIRKIERWVESGAPDN